MSSSPNRSPYGRVGGPGQAFDNKAHFDLGENKKAGALENLLTGKSAKSEIGDNSDRGGGSGGGGEPTIFSTDQNLTDEERRFQEQEQQEQFFMELLRGKQYRLVRERLLRRLIFEQNFRREMKICFLFLINMVSFMVLINMAYPSGMISPVHEYLVKHFGLPLDVNNLDELDNVLKDVAIKSRYFSPGSNLYTNDFYSNVYLPSPAKFPPQQLVPFKEQPKILPNMTITAWLKSTSRLDTIIEKQRVFSGGYQSCWRFGLEQVLYGLHEGSRPHTVVNPLAGRLHQEGADEDAEWRISATRRKYNSGQWHHWAITIENGRDFQFFADGISTTKVYGSYVLTDCPDGTVYLGSGKIESELQGISFYPRILAQPEIIDVMEIGMPLANFLAARTPPIANPNQLDELTEWSALKDIEDAASETRQRDDTNELMRRLSSFILHDAGIDNGAIGSSSVGSSGTSSSSSSSHRRLLSTNFKPESSDSESEYNNNFSTKRLLAGAAATGGTTTDTFSPKAQYEVMHTADWNTCVNAQHHTCELIILHGTRKRLAGKFSKVMSEYGTVQSELANWCTDNIGKQDGVNANYTYAECHQLIGAFKDHKYGPNAQDLSKTYYESSGGSDDSTGGGHRRNLINFHGRLLAGAAAGASGGGNSSTLYHLSAPDSSHFEYPR